MDENELAWIDFWERFDGRINELISTRNITWEQAEEITRNEFGLND
jgi:hypothetical protein